MDKVSILKIRDKDEDQEAMAIVRSVNGYVALTLSLEHDGDVQIAFTPSECAELISRLQEAVFDAQGGTLVTSKPIQSSDSASSRIEEVNLDSGRKVKHG